MSDNPLTRLPESIEGRGALVHFDEVTPDHLKPALDRLLEEASLRLRTLTSFEGARTYENTMVPYDRLTEPLDFAMTVAGHLESVATTPELRTAYNDAQARSSAFYSELSVSEPLARAVRDFASTPEAAALPPAKKRFVEKTVAEFRRAGAYLPAAEKARLQAIDVELSKVTLTFSQNVVDSTTAFELVVEEPSKLEGLPEGAIAAAKASAESKGKTGWRFTLAAPSYLGVMTHLDDRAMRETVWRAYNTRATRAPHDNRPLLGEILKLRDEKAKLLGYANFADLVLEDRMAKSGAKARAFVGELHAKTAAFFERENRELVEFARAKLGLSALEPWDVGYVAEKLRRERFDFDEEALRPYFALDRVLGGMFEIAQSLYAIDVAPWPEGKTWHPDVRAYRVTDSKTRAPLASFYLDAFPRESKRDGAWMNGLWTHVPRAGESPSEHVGVLCLNSTPPVGDEPALLTHREVETLFHEFGHLLHHVLSKVDVRLAAGTNVAWDFVELPSQIMENWTWEKPALEVFARHYQTGAPLPDELLRRLKASRTYRAANMQMRQLGFAETDLALHIDFRPEKDSDVVAAARRIAQKYSVSTLPDDYAMIASFGHIFGSPVGYAAAYYSYKWAEVLEADAFRTFREEGLFSPEVGARFKDRLLSKGDTEDPMALFVAFTGHEPDVAALLERSGLAGAHA